MKKFYTIIFILALSLQTSAQYGRNGFSLAVGFNYTTTSSFFPNPKASDPYIANYFEELKGIIHYSISIRYKLSSIIALELNSEYMRKTYFDKSVNAISPAGVIRLESKEGYVVIPIELNIVYLLPFSTDLLKFDMSAGIATYLGKHIREFGNVKTETTIESFPFGIQVGVGTEYLITDYLSARFEMRFRDPELNFDTKYVNRSVEYKDMNVYMPVESFKSKVNINGISFGIRFSFHI